MDTLYSRVRLGIQGCNMMRVGINKRRNISKTAYVTAIRSYTINKGSRSIYKQFYKICKPLKLPAWQNNEHSSQTCACDDVAHLFFSPQNAQIWVNSCDRNESNKSPGCVTQTQFAQYWAQAWVSSCSIWLISRFKLIGIERNIEVLIICRNEQLVKIVTIKIYWKWIGSLFPTNRA